MKVYVALRYNRFTSSTTVGEVFVNEEDAKNYKAQVEVDDYDVSVNIVPRTPRTAWNG